MPHSRHPTFEKTKTDVPNHRYCRNTDDKRNGPTSTHGAVCHVQTRMPRDGMAPRRQVSAGLSDAAGASPGPSVAENCATSRLPARHTELLSGALSDPHPGQLRHTCISKSRDRTRERTEELATPPRRSHLPTRPPREGDNATHRGNEPVRPRRQAKTMIDGDAPRVSGDGPAPRRRRRGGARARRAWRLDIARGRRPRHRRCSGTPWPAVAVAGTAVAGPGLHLPSLPNAFAINCINHGSIIATAEWRSG